MALAKLTYRKMNSYPGVNIHSAEPNQNLRAVLNQALTDIAGFYKPWGLILYKRGVDPYYRLPQKFNPSAREYAFPVYQRKIAPPAAISLNDNGTVATLDGVIELGIPPGEIIHVKVRDPFVTIHKERGPDREVLYTEEWKYEKLSVFFNAVNTDAAARLLSRLRLNPGNRPDDLRNRIRGIYYKTRDRKAAMGSRDRFMEFIWEAL